MFKFYVFQNDIQSISCQADPKDELLLNYGTSVNTYKQHFFTSLREFGDLIVLNDADPSPEEIKKLKEPGAVVAFVHYFGEMKPFFSQLKLRLLHLSLGAPLLPKVYTMKLLSTAQVELVSTEFIRRRLETVFHDLFPKTFVFAPHVDTEFFVPPTAEQREAARIRYGIREGKTHLIYVGRKIVTKGICQLIRMLDARPIPDLVLTVVGNFDEEDSIYISMATHKTFPDYFRQEILRGKRREWLIQKPSLGRDALRELFWSADLYAYPSISPDENFGIASWEAAACGLPVVVTNFGGLHDLAEYMPWKGVETYPSFQGARFGLRSFYECLQEAILACRMLPEPMIQQKIRKTVSPEINRANLAAALEYLYQTPAEPLFSPEAARQSLKKALTKSIRRQAYDLFAFGRTGSTRPKPGMTFYGDVWNKPNWPLIYGLYAAADLPPDVQPHTSWRGFFRTAPWHAEKALIEFGFPGPRIKRYSAMEWETLMACAQDTGNNDYLFLPENGEQAYLVQELVNLGYLTSDEP